MEEAKHHIRLIESRLDEHDNYMKTLVGRLDDQDIHLKALIEVTTDIKNALIFGQVAAKIVRGAGYIATAIVAVWLFGEKVWSWFKLH